MFPAFQVHFIRGEGIGGWNTSHSSSTIKIMALDMDTPLLKDHAAGRPAITCHRDRAFQLFHQIDDHQPAEGGGFLQGEFPAKANAVVLDFYQARLMWISPCLCPGKACFRQLTMISLATRPAGTAWLMPRWSSAPATSVLMPWTLEPKELSKRFTSFWRY